MLTFSFGPMGRVVRVGGLLVVAALILVPSLLRAMQHFDPRDNIRLSIRLNWNGDAPPTKAKIAPDDAPSPVILPAVVVEQAGPAHLPRHPHTLDDECISCSLLDNTPDLVRGPPAAPLT
jgi:hypothetical protein